MRMFWRNWEPTSRESNFQAQAAALSSDSQLAFHGKIPTSKNIELRIFGGVVFVLAYFACRDGFGRKLASRCRNNAKIIRIDGKEFFKFIITGFASISYWN